MKAVILAAGLGSRLKHLTKESPKCMLSVDNKPLIEYQLDALEKNNITDISIVKGYLKEKISYPQYKEFLNEDYINNNILCSLMYAESFLNEEVIISYSDIIYFKDIVKDLSKSKENISIVVDRDWRKKYVGRNSHPEAEAEKALYNEKKYALKLGKIIDGNLNGVGEFIGLLKLSPKGCEIFKEEYTKAKKEFSGKPFINASVFEKSYLTDFLNHLILLGYKIHCTLISDGWREIDTEQDFENAHSWVKSFKKVG